VTSLAYVPSTLLLERACVTSGKVQKFQSRGNIPLAKWFQAMVARFCFAYLDPRGPAPQDDRSALKFSFCRLQPLSLLPLFAFL
jgi:hypothetical protein